MDSTEEGETVYLGSPSTCLDLSLSFPGPTALHKKFILITFVTDLVYTVCRERRRLLWQLGGLTSLLGNVYHQNNLHWQ